MPSPTTTYPAFVSAFKTGLEARFAATTGLEDVKVFTAAITPGVKPPMRAVVFVKAVTPERETTAMPDVNDDTYDLIGFVTATQTGRTNIAGDETAAVAVRNQCLALLDVVTVEAKTVDVNYVPDAQVLYAQMTDTDWDEGVAPETQKRRCQVEFVIRVKGRV